MKEVISFIKNKGVDLYQCSHIKNFIFKVKDSLELLEIMKKQNILVYGGDIMKYENARYEYTYNNWSYNENSSLESIEFAIEKINFFSKEIDHEVFIQLTYNFDFYDEIKNL